MLKLLIIALIIYLVWKATRSILAPHTSGQNGRRPGQNPWNDWKQTAGGRGGRSRQEKDITNRTRIIDENQGDDR